jgi:hypothetical protein
MDAGRCTHRCRHTRMHIQTQADLHTDTGMDGQMQVDICTDAGIDACLYTYLHTHGI